MQAAWARPSKYFPSVCVSNDKHIMSNHKCISCYSWVRALAAKMPNFPMVVFQRESRSVTHFCVYGKSKLWYQVQLKSKQVPTIMADHPLQATSVFGMQCNSIYPWISGSLLGVIFTVQGETEQTDLKKQTQTFRTKLVVLFFSNFFKEEIETTFCEWSPADKQRRTSTLRTSARAFVFVFVCVCK